MSDAHCPEQAVLQIMKTKGSMALVAVIEIGVVRETLPVEHDDAMAAFRLGWLHAVSVFVRPQNQGDLPSTGHGDVCE